MTHVVCLCGSARFADEIRSLALNIELDGDVALTPVLDVVAGSLGRQALDAIHRRKIMLADSVYVVNVGGYIGDSTRSEINYAAELGKPIEYLESVPMRWELAARHAVNPFDAEPDGR